MAQDTVTLVNTFFTEAGQPDHSHRAAVGVTSPAECGAAGMVLQYERKDGVVVALALAAQLEVDGLPGIVARRFEGPTASTDGQRWTHEAREPCRDPTSG
jgi:hypothetical protein